MSWGATQIDASDRPRLIEGKTLAIGGAVAAVAWITLVPVIFLLRESFLTAETATAPAQFTFENYLLAYASAETLHLFGNSVAFAIGSASLAFAVGTFLAWVNERTNTAFKSLFFALALIPLVIPAILFTVSWILLASPKIGIINLALQQMFDTNAVFVNVYSLGGMIWVDGLHQSPLAFLLMTAAFRSMDPSLEESALMSGATVPQTVRRVTLKLVLPAMLGGYIMLFIRALESFEVPALIGLPVGIEVYTSSIYQAIQSYPSQVGLASAYAAGLLVVASLCMVAQTRVTKEAGSFSTVTGKGFRPRTMNIGRWRYATATTFIVYVMLIVALPFCVLVWSSLQRFYSVPSMAALKSVSLATYRTVLDDPRFLGVVWNSTLLSIGSATAIMLLAAVLSWIVVRTKLPGRWMLDNLASLPLVFPGLVLGLAIMVCYLNVKIGIYGTLWIMLIAYVTRFMPYGMRYSATSMIALHRELEESAAMSGASWMTTFWRILVPLLKPGLIAGWIYVVIVSVRELSGSILLYSPDTEVVSIMIWEYWQNGQYAELCALGVMLIATLFCFVLLAQFVSRRFGIAEPGH